ncbi:MAG: alpha/beta fold hydrolase [Acidimicrobiia bacterium]
MRSYEADGLVFDLTDAGPVAGEVVVLLHGFPGSRSCWDGVVPVLADAGYRVLAPDQRGYSPGVRPSSRRGYRIDRLAADVLALADAAGAAACTSWGTTWVPRWPGTWRCGTRSACSA